MSLSKEQLIKNSAWTFLELTLYPILMIVATPVFIRKLGIEQYGLWMLITTITQGINVLNIGVGETNIRFISENRAGNNFNPIKKVFHYNFSLSLFLCMIALVIGLLFSAFDFVGLFYKSEDYHFANTILLLACCSAGVKFVEIAILSVFKAFERFDINSKLTILSKNSVMILNLLLVVMHYDLVVVFSFTVLLNFLNVLLQVMALRSFQSSILSFPSFHFLKERSGYIRYNFWYWLQSVIALLGFLADRFVVAWFTDVKTLGYYSIASLIGIQIHNFFLAFGGFIFPRVSFSMATNQEILPLYYVSRALVALAGWCITCFLLLYGDFIFMWWLGPETYSHSIQFIKLYLVFESCILLIIVPFYFINSSSRIQLNSYFEMIICTSHFVAMLAGFFLSGVNGILYGLIISTLINLPFQYYFFHKRVIGKIKWQQCILVILPVFFIASLIISPDMIFRLSLILGLALSSKLIYFDPARQYSKGTWSLRNVLGKPEGK